MKTTINDEVSFVVSVTGILKQLGGRDERGKKVPAFGRSETK